MASCITDSDIEQIKAGDWNTWQRAKEDFEGKMRSRAKQLLQNSTQRNQVTPEDLVQETWLKAWNYRDSFKGSSLSELVRWLQTILKNTFLDQCRKKSQFSLTAPASVMGVGRSPSENLRIDEKTSHLADYVQQLDQVSRNIVILRNDHGLKFREIANRLGMNVHTVSGTYRRAIRKLRRAMAKFESGSQSMLS